MKKLALILFAIAAALSCSDDSYLPFNGSDSPIYPDYRNVTIPVGIAPLNFSYTESASGKPVTTFSFGDERIKFKGRRVEWNRRKWAKLIERAKGSEITVSSDVAGEWKIFVSNDAIDYGLQYRLIAPGYQLYGEMFINERRLSDFDERTIISGSSLNSCVNCHEYNRADVSEFSIHTRGKHGSTIIGHNGDVQAYETKTESTLGKCVYPYWHPSGDYIAYSTNITHQQFHSGGKKIIEVFDEDSDALVYDVRNNRVISCPALKDTTWLENYPVFSADGTKLYFCRAPQNSSILALKVRRYDLCSIDFDPSTGTLGNEITTVINSAETGYSVAFPRPSYDGRFIMYASLDYGLFPIWHKESDLWLLDLRDGSRRRLDAADSDDAESFHNFSSNSRWFVFGSRRDDGRFTHAYISHIDEDGNVTKPFMLPQKNPARYYTRQFYSYNTPCFVNGPFEANRFKCFRKAMSEERKNFD